MTKLSEVLAKILMIKPEQITDSTSPENTKSWDSLNGLTMVSEIENQFSVKLTTQEVVSIKCVGDIKATLKNHGVSVD